MSNQEGVSTCCCCCATIDQGNIGVLENWGKYEREVPPGLICLCPCRDNVAGTVSTRLMEAHANVESKSRDSVFITVKLKVQYAVLRNKKDSVKQAYYSLENPRAQIESYIHNSVRGQIPRFDLDQIFLMRGEISEAVKQEIDNAMDEYGYDIQNVLIVDLDVGAKVTNAMNSIQTYQREKNAMVDQAEAQKIAVVKAAEADAEAKRLSGVGLAEQRKAIVAGLQSSVEMFRQGVPGLSNDDVMSLLLLNQYFDTLKDVARHSSAVSLFISHSGGLNAVAKQMEEGVLHTGNRGM
jgi:regulator of protease activity HflC (stomatin/prohibitin superfamily)